MSANLWAAILDAHRPSGGPSTTHGVRGVRTGDRSNGAVVCLFPFHLEAPMTQTPTNQTLNLSVLAQQARRTTSSSAALGGVRRVVFIGNHTPRQCGIATFTAHIADSVPVPEALVVAMNDEGAHYDYPERVGLSLEQQDLAAYGRAAGQINAMHPDVVCVQHEYGIFGGPAGAHLLTTLRGLEAPIVTTLHTVLENPNPEQRAVFEELVALSAKLIVMSERAVQMLRALGVPAHKIEMVFHGVPTITLDPAQQKVRLGVQGRPLILTFGLIGRGKGLEHAIRALPEIVRAHPDALYLILGATHPHVLRHEGERYREELQALASELGVADNLRMDNRYVDQATLEQYIAAADIYLTPYLNCEQITSGTLAYAVGNGKAVVSTPYWHAEELLSEDRGVLVPFGDAPAIGRAVSALLSDPAGRAAMQARALAAGLEMRWPAVGQAYLDVFEQALAGRHAADPRPAVPRLDLTHLGSLTDPTGLYQHATGCVPNPHEGYTTDDNARALSLLAGLPAQLQTSAAGLQLARIYLGFLHAALDPVSGKFRNFMGYERRWLEAVGAENAQARAVRGLVNAAVMSSAGPLGALAEAAAELLRRARHAATDLISPRAQAIALLAASELRERPALAAEFPELEAAAQLYAANLLGLHAAASRPRWDWFEPYLSYANAELPHGLIAYGRAFGHPEALALGLRTLAWLDGQQRLPGGQFLPIGCERVYHRGEARPLWDGQPIEASVTVSACLAAMQAESERQDVWQERAERALAWLLGDNLLGLPLYDARSGGSRDGLHRDRASANQGAESTVLLWQAVADLGRAGTAARTRHRLAAMSAD